MVKCLNGAVLVFKVETPFYMKKNNQINFQSIQTTPKTEAPDAKYWREKYEISTKHLMVAVKEWGRLRQQVEEYRSKAA